ncbi:MAG: nucleoside hydrolase [Pirellulales bacterium]
MRKVILDMDPGYDDALALCAALGEPRLEVIAATATGGNVPPEQASLNVQALIEQLDPPRWPRIGTATAEQILRTDGRAVHGTGGLCGAEFDVAILHNRHLSIKVLADEVRAAPGEVTIIATGPLSNIASVLRREPDIAPLIGHLIILGGAVGVSGDVTQAAEFNIFCDAEAAQIVFRSPVTKTIIPLDVTEQVVMTYDFLDWLKSREENSRTAQLLLKIVSGAYRVHRQRLALEGIYVHAAVAVIAAVHPELFTMHRLRGEVETDGELTYGTTIFDRRRLPDNQPNMDVALEIDTVGVVDALLRALDQAV